MIPLQVISVDPFGHDLNRIHGQAKANPSSLAPQTKVVGLLDSMALDLAFLVLPKLRSLAGVTVETGKVYGKPRFFPDRYDSAPRTESNGSIHSLIVQCHPL